MLYYIYEALLKCLDSTKKNATKQIEKKLMISLSKKDDAGSDEDPFNSESESDMDTEELDAKITAHQA